MEPLSRRRAVSPTSSTPSRGIRRTGARDAKLRRTFWSDSRIAGDGGARRSCPVEWCKSVALYAASGALGRDAQAATRGSLTVRLSLMQCAFAGPYFVVLI